MNQATIRRTTRYAYQAQTADGAAMAGTIEAADVDDARIQLQTLGLVVLELTAERVRPPKPKRISGDDFVAFNQQLTALTAASLPLEKGLRLIGGDMPSKRLKRTVDDIAAELENGRSLEDAFEKYADRFPTHYGRVLAAGVKSGNLQAVLINVGKQVQMTHRLRSTLSRAAAYPAVVLAMIVGVLVFVSFVVVPPMESFFGKFRIELPLITRALFGLADAVPGLLVLIGVTLLAVLIWWRLMKMRGRDHVVIETLFWPMPLLGTVLKRSAIARWCGALRIGVNAGLDLPTSIELAGEAVGSPAARQDGQYMIDTLQAGATIDQTVGLRLIPQSTIVSMQLAADRGDLADTLDQLTLLYESQAEQRLGILRSALAPITLVVIATMIFFVIMGLTAPLSRLIGSMMYI